MAVLYRKYRPQTFNEVLNQKYIIQTLKNQVAATAVGHAYLFTGSRGVGKTSIARILAKAVNCEEGTKRKAQDGKWGGDACGQCNSCKQIEQGNFLDLVEIDAASNTGVDNIRELIEHVKFSPTTGLYKVFIIDEVHMLSKGAFNALLKTLEEPPKHAIFILATTEIGKVPATIISRTQRFDFKTLSPEDLEKHLEKILEKEQIKLPQAVVQLVARNAEGSVRDCLSLLDKVLTLGENVTIEESEQLLGITDISICERLFSLITSGTSKDIPPFFDILRERGLDFAVFNRDFLEYLRKVLVFKVAGQETLDGQHRQELASLAEQVTVPELIFAIRLFLRSYKDLDFSPSPEIPLLISSLEAAARKSNPVSGNGGAKKPVIQDMAAKTAPAEKVAVAAPQESAADKAVLAAKQEPTATLEEVRNCWEQVITKVREINGPLASLLKMFPVQSVSGSTIIVGVNFLFHKQSLDSAKNQTILCQVLDEVLGKKMRVRGQVVKEEVENKGAGEVLADALKIFGGELVE